jgi:hypothetical protein
MNEKKRHSFASLFFYVNKRIEKKIRYRINKYFQGAGSSTVNDERRLANSASTSSNNYSSMGFTGPHGVTTPTSATPVQPTASHGLE